MRKNNIKLRRVARNRIKISGTASVPRLSVFRSSKYIYAQLIDDDKSKTLISGSTAKIEEKGKSKQAEILGSEIGKKALDAGIKKAVFDRGPYKYHGRVKSLAEGARKTGLKM